MIGILIEVFTSNHISERWNENSNAVFVSMFFQILNIIYLLFSIPNVRKWIKELREEREATEEVIHQIENVVGTR